MASLLKVDSLTGVTTAGSISVTGEGNSTTTNLQQGLNKGFVAFNGTGTIAADDSFNLSSLADAGTGDYDANWTNVMGISVYMMSGMKSHSVSDTSCNLKISSRSSNFTASTVRVRSIENASAADSDYVSMMCHGDLA